MLAEGGAEAGRFRITAFGGDILDRRVGGFQHLLGFLDTQGLNVFGPRLAGGNLPRPMLLPGQYCMNYMRRARIGVPMSLPKTSATLICHVLMAFVWG